MGVTPAPSLEILNFLNKGPAFQHALGHQFMELVPVASFWMHLAGSGMTLGRSQLKMPMIPKCCMNSSHRWEGGNQNLPVPSGDSEVGQQAKEGTGGQA